MHRKFYHEIDNSTVNPTGNQLKKKEHTQKTTQRTNRVRKKKKNNKLKLKMKMKKSAGGWKTFKSTV